MIVNGSQQALDVIGKVFIDQGSPIAVERPTYLAALQAFSAYGPKYAEVWMDENGPLPCSCECDLHNGQCRFFYTVPSFQNPSGTCVTMQRRKELADVINKSGCMLVEDDPYSQLYYDEKPAGPLCTYGVNQAIFCGTFSKMVAPGFRLGWIWAKKDVMRHLITAKQAADLCTGTFQQLLLLETLMQLDVQKHLENNRGIYKKKRDAMDGLMHKYIGKYLTWKKPGGGMFFWVKVKDTKMDVKMLLKKCIENGVAFADGSAFFASHVKEKYLRLNFTQASDEEMEKGVRVMGEQFKRLREESESGKAWPAFTSAKEDIHY
jgi:2-aminoadipate transaminase